jgi:CheY-like chemotaxis protein
MLRRLIGEGITLRVQGAEDLWFVRADPGQLEQVLVNLVVNSRDAINDGGEILITTCNQELSKDGPRIGRLRPGKYVCLSVADNGRGMSEAVKEKLFEPFFTTKEFGEGTGLGLATVYGSVQQNGGEVQVESCLGQGTSFHIYLPKVEAPANKQESKKPVSGRQRRGGTETVVLVEDELSVLELSQQTLEGLGYRVLSCSSADEALRIFQQQKGGIDLLVTDVVMPRMNGKELAARIAALHPEVAVLFTSGYSENILATNGELEANLYFLAKPYRPAQLGEKVREVLDERLERTSLASRTVT